MECISYQGSLKHKVFFLFVYGLVEACDSFFVYVYDILEQRARSTSIKNCLNIWNLLKGSNITDEIQKLLILVILKL